MAGKILSGMCVRNCDAWEVYTWWDIGLGDVGV